MQEETLAKNVKKIIKWGKGYAVFITKEAKLLKWNDKDYVSISAVKDSEGDKILIRKLEVK